MNIKILASGSTGNCVYISNGAVNVVIDVGLPKTKIEKVMLENEINPAEVTAIFITHEHKDHVQGLSLADKYKIPLYASEGTLKELGRLESGNRMVAGGVVGFNALDRSLMLLRSFNVHHDAMEPFGFTIKTVDTKISVLMDTGKVDSEMLRFMADSDVYVFECNHDQDMLESGPYDPKTKSRILSDIGHLSNDAAAAALARLVRGHGERIYLTHMSSNNNMPALAAGIVKKALREKGLQAGKHYQLEVV